MRLIVLDSYSMLSHWAAAYIVKRINEFKPTAERPFVIGLPSGNTPLGTYRHLIQYYEKGKVSFKNVVVFVTDEYFVLPESHPESHHSLLNDHLFRFIDIPKENINILNGNASDPERECAEYECKIKDYGGIDIFIGGVGTDGHFAANEPGSSLTSRTRVKCFTSDSIIENSKFFGNDINKVPKCALTMGVSTIMDSREIIILANGRQKARALHHAIEGPISQLWPISVIQLHKRVIVVCDDIAVSDLKVGTVKYFKDIEKNNPNPDILL
ncbi:MAG: glucosamine-6-phosphate deaminase [Bacteroidales bacterium]|jgi:glucosamine-6-phosphate deaminase|nr:glucosamine-6-phosphate deaminase [Bacteroidales bacterium]